MYHPFLKVFVIAAVQVILRNKVERSIATFEISGEQAESGDTWQDAEHVDHLDEHSFTIHVLVEYLGRVELTDLLTIRFIVRQHLFLLLFLRLLTCILIHFCCRKLFCDYLFLLNNHLSVLLDVDPLCIAIPGSSSGSVVFLWVPTCKLLTKLSNAKFCLFLRFLDFL